VNFKEWLMALFGLTPTDTSERVSLDTQQNQIAGRLSKMTGTTRDEVLSEAYRRARLAKEAQSYRPRR
jgi:hypothetical protein